MASQSEIRKPLKPSSPFRMSVIRRRLPWACTPFQVLYEIMTVPTPASTAAT